MAARTPYRSAPARSEKAHVVSLVDMRPLVALLLFAVVAVTLCLVQFPRSVHVSCAPAESSVRCVATSQVRGLAFTAMRREAAVYCAAESRARPFATDDDRGAAPGPLHKLTIRFDYRGGGRKRPSTTYLIASCGGGPVELTAGHTGLTDSGSLSRLFAFRDALQAGQGATLEYTIGWGDPVTLLLGGLLTLAALFSGAHTRVSIDRERGLLEIFYRPGFVRRAKRTTVELGRVRNVLLVSDVGHRNREVYVPALRLESDSVVRLGAHGFNDRARGQGVVDRLRGLLGIKAPPERVAPGAEAPTAVAKGDGPPPRPNSAQGRGPRSGG